MPFQELASDCRLGCCKLYQSTLLSLFSTIFATFCFPLTLSPTPFRIFLVFFSIVFFVHLILAIHHPNILPKLFLISSSWLNRITHLLVMVFHWYCQRLVQVSFLTSLLVQVAIIVAILLSFSNLTSPIRTNITKSNNQGEFVCFGDGSQFG